MKMLGSRPDGQRNESGINDDGYAPPPAKDKPKPSFDDLGDDIPF